ncbi:MAG: preQ(1) synthase [Phycisphaerae bacterium]
MADATLLEVFPNPHPDRNYLIVHTAHEFTSLCPVTSQPDFATITFRYVADQRCLELRSLKRYLQSYRNDGIYFEDVTGRLLNDIVTCCQPRWIEVETCWNVRGGIGTTVTAQHGDRSVAPGS